MENKSPFDIEKRNKWFENVSPWKRLMARQNVNTILLLGLFALLSYVVFWMKLNNFPSQLLLALAACRDNGAIGSVIENSARNVSIDSVFSRENIISFCSMKGYDGGYFGALCPVNCYEMNADGWTRNDCFKFSDVFGWTVNVTAVNVTE